MKIDEQIVWNFPGGTLGLLLALAAAAALAFLSYRHTLRNIPAKAKMWLAALRTILFFLVILCLCDPSVVRKTSPPPTERKKKVAVLVDSSSSMAVKGFSGETRYQRAIDRWNDGIFDADEKYDFKLFLFNENTRETREFPELPPAASGKLRKTFLFKNVEQWAKRFESEGFDAAICLSDGVDTSKQPIRPALSALSASRLRFAFVPATLELPSPPRADILKLECPATTKPGREAPVSILLGVAGIEPDRKLELSVFDPRGKRVFQKRVKWRNLDFSTIPCEFEVPVDALGTKVFKAELKLDGKLLTQCRWSVRGVKNERQKILLFQGGLDWGTRFLRGVFDRDDTTKLDVRFAPRSFGNVANAIIQKFPYDTLEDYDLVMVLKMRRSQIDSRMAGKLREYLKNGGGLLFITANNLDAAEYADSPLESLLPVEFLRGARAGDPRVNAFLRTMGETLPGTGKIPPLRRMVLTEEGKRSALFEYLKTIPWRDKIPKFQAFAVVEKRKPGARILATHPKNKKAIILATQRFGKGRSAVLACDPLWGWKLSIPSENQSFDLFWKNIANWLCAGHVRSPHWTAPNRIMTPGRPNKIKFIDASGEKLEFFALDTKTKQKHPLSLSRGKNKNERYVDFIPEPKRAYQFIALNRKKEVVALAWFQSADSAADIETLYLKPNLDALRDLAAASPKNSFVPPNAKFDWKNWLPDAKPESALVIEKKPLWHTAWLFILILTLILAELLIRRTLKLL